MYFEYKDLNRLKAKRWKKAHHVLLVIRKLGRLIMVSDKTDFRIGNITRDNEGQLIMTTGLLNQGYNPKCSWAQLRQLQNI